MESPRRDEEDNACDADADEPQPRLRGSELWDTVLEWMKALGTAAAREKLANLDKCLEYRAWLEEETGLVGLVEGQKQWEPNSKHVVCILDLPSAMGREVGHRAVSHAGLLQKMRDLCFAQVWREWDEVKLCRIEAACGNHMLLISD